MQLMPLSHRSMRACSSRLLFSKLTFALASIALASMLLPDRAHATVFDWSNSEGGYFNDGPNWAGGVAPTNGSGNIAFFSLNSSYTAYWGSNTATLTPGIGLLDVDHGQVVFQNNSPTAQWEFSVNNFNLPHNSNALTVEGAATSLTIRGLHLKDYGGAYLNGGATLTIDGAHPYGANLSVLGDSGLTINKGNLNVLAGGGVTNTVGYLGVNASQYGVAYISGPGSQWNNSSILQVGVNSFGNLQINDGGVVTNTDAFLGYNSGSTGEADVIGIGSKWNNSGFVWVGLAGTGMLYVADGGLVTSNNGVIGTGTAAVTGSGSQWAMSSYLSMGQGATGSLTVADSGLVSVFDTTYLGPGGTININGGFLTTYSLDNSAHGALNLNDGKVTVNGVGGTFNPGTADFKINGNTAAALPTLAISNTASLTLSNNLTIGDTNKGNLSVSAGSVVSNAIGLLGQSVSSTGTATVNGANSKWINSIQLQVGVAGNGTLNVEAGGKVTDTDGFVGIQSGSTGVVTVTGTGSQWNTSANLGIGLSGNGTLSVANGGQVSVGGTLAVGSLGLLKGNGGTIVGTVTNAGLVAPGNSAGLLTVTGNYIQFSAGQLEIQLGGTTPITGYDQFHVSGQLVLGGTLAVQLLNGFEPQSGNSFDILDGTIVGTFTTLSLPTLTGALTWNTSQLYNTGVLSVVGAGVSGDYNNNGVVNAADYVVWRNNPGGFPADAYATWRSHFGQTSGSGAGEIASAAVPEPATLVLLLFAAGGWRLRRGRAA